VNVPHERDLLLPKLEISSIREEDLQEFLLWIKWSGFRNSVSDVIRQVSSGKQMHTHSEPLESSSLSPLTHMPRAADVPANWGKLPVYSASDQRAATSQ